ncbi:MAG: MOSC N-terminal beta barrel domain-containing protein [Planctomycetota bacterium]|nr:MOSC N-terminal beta barrel domain-containing protein [Planctomycetaceae bacterium]MDQ3329289.1 MOSC N-terminal beta barrel domain-containing protein [Planctomycetota bacterium]
MDVRLVRIDLYPVKSLPGVHVTEARILPSGCLEHDRRYALFDADGKLINGKRTPLVHRIRLSSFDRTREQITIGDRESDRCETFSLVDGRAAIESFLSDRLGVAVMMREDAALGFPDDTLASGPTVIASETLAEVGNWFSLDVEDARQRFRANLMIEGGGPFWEDRLFGPPGETVTFRIGEAMLFGTNPCARCVVPSRDPESGEQDRGFAKAFAERRRNSLPAWADMDAFDHCYRLAVNTRHFAPAEGAVIRVGDRVELVNS